MHGATIKITFMLFNFKENTHFIDKNGAVPAINFTIIPFARGLISRPLL